MAIVKAEDLDGIGLNWAVAKCEGKVGNDIDDFCLSVPGEFDYSTNWALSGLIIDREKICLYPNDPVMPKAVLIPKPDDNPHYYFRQYGETSLIAAMRCFVACKMGDEVDVPDELLAIAPVIAG